MMKIGIIISLILISLIGIVDAKPLEISENILYSSIPQGSYENTPWTNVKTLTMTNNYTGNWSIHFTYGSQPSYTNYVYAQIRKNGTLYGASYSCRNETDGCWVGVTQSFTNISIIEGEQIQLWVRSDHVAFPIYYQDFIIYATLINNIPSIPQISTPTNNSRHWNNSINFTWNASTDGDGDTLTYQRQISTSPTFATTLNESYTSNLYSDNITTTDGTTYYLRVRSYDDYEYSSWSNTVLFTENSIPTVPALIQHSDYHNIGTTTVNWTASSDNNSDLLTYNALVYNITIGTLLFNTTGITNNYSQDFTTADWTEYNYTVRSYDGYEYSAWAIASTFGFTNTAPTYQDTVLSPSTLTSAQNLTATFNYTDADGDTVTNSTRWYKNGVLQSSLNDTLTVLASGNTSNGETWYFKVYGNDSYEQGSEYASNQVIIGSSNAAPSVTNLTILPTVKYNKTFWINASGITDDSSTWQVQAYIYNDSDKEYLGNSSWTNEPYVNYSVTNPWISGTKTIYVVVYDSGNITGVQNLSSSEITASFTVDTTPPTVTSSSLSATSVTVGQGVTITAVLNGEGANITSATVQVERPDATTANWTMTCGSGETPTCTKSYTSTSDVGTYYVRNFYMTDDSEVAGTASSNLSFNAATVVSGTSGTSSSSGSTVIIKEKDTNVTQIPQVLFTNPTDTRSVKDLEEIGRCLENSLMLSSPCSTGVVTVVTNPTNWWVMIGAYLASILTLFGMAVIEQRPRRWGLDMVLYGSIAWMFVLGFSVLGFNMFFFNYVFNSPLPGFMAMSFGVFGIFVTAIGDHFSYSSRLAQNLKASGKSTTWTWNK